MNKIPQRKNTTEDTELDTRLLPSLALVMVLVFGGLLIVLICAAHWWKPFELDKFGQLGDYFGGILNPVASTLTLIVAIAVWKLQRQALATQKQELEETRNAIKEQTRDQFFMGMLSAHRSMIEQVAYLDSSHKELHSGKRAIDTYFRELNNSKKKVDSVRDGSAKGVTPVTPPDLTIYEDLAIDLPKKFPIKFNPTYSVAPYMCGFCVRFYSKNYSLRDLEIRLASGFVTFEQVFGHIFRSTYQILKLIDEEFDRGTQKSKRYVNLLRAQMSESEFVFFALSALTIDGQKSWARAVRLDFFEDRLQNTDWTRELVEYFKPTESNLKLANQLLEQE